MSCRLTVVFEYGEGSDMEEAKAMFNKGNIPNLVGVVEYDAIEAIKNINKSEVKKLLIMCRDELIDTYDDLTGNDPNKLEVIRLINEYQSCFEVLDDD